MIYLDTSVVLAHLLAENREPPQELWDQPLASSRLLEYETWTRIHALRRAGTHGESVRALLHRVAMIELEPRVLARATEPFPRPVRTLDAIHLASIEYLRHELRQPVELASYDGRQIAVARAMGVAVAQL